MENLLNVNLINKIEILGLIFARIFGLFTLTPVLSSEVIQLRSRVTLALLFGVILFSSCEGALSPIPTTPIVYGMLVLGQALVGVLLGFMILTIFSAFQIIGEIYSTQMGISFSEILDPQAQVSLPLLGTLKNSIGILIFLGLPFQMDGIYAPAILHSLRALAFSFKAIPNIFLTDQVTGGILNQVTQTFSTMFILSLKIGIPMIGILFISSLTLGLLGKAAPQLNLMNLGIQVNISLGLIVLIFLTPVFIPLMNETFVILFDQIANLLQTWPKKNQL